MIDHHLVSKTNIADSSSCPSHDSNSLSNDLKNGIDKNFKPIRFIAENKTIINWILDQQMNYAPPSHLSKAAKESAIQTVQLKIQNGNSPNYENMTIQNELKPNYSKSQTGMDFKAQRKSDNEIDVSKLEIGKSKSFSKLRKIGSYHENNINQSRQISSPPKSIQDINQSPIISSPGGNRPGIFEDEDICIDNDEIISGFGSDVLQINSTKSSTSKLLELNRARTFSYSSSPEDKQSLPLESEFTFENNGLLSLSSNESSKIYQDTGYRKKSEPLLISDISNSRKLESIEKPKNAKGRTKARIITDSPLSTPINRQNGQISKTHKSIDNLIQTSEKSNNEQPVLKSKTISGDSVNYNNSKPMLTKFASYSSSKPGSKTNSIDMSNYLISVVPLKDSDNETGMVKNSGPYGKLVTSNDILIDTHSKINSSTFVGKISSEMYRKVINSHDKKSDENNGYRTESKSSVHKRNSNNGETKNNLTAKDTSEQNFPRRHSEEFKNPAIPTDQEKGKSLKNRNTISSPRVAQITNFLHKDHNSAGLNSNSPIIAHKDQTSLNKQIQKNYEKEHKTKAKAKIII